MGEKGLAQIIFTQHDVFMELYWQIEAKQQQGMMSDNRGDVTGWVQVQNMQQESSGMRTRSVYRRQVGCRTPVFQLIPQMFLNQNHDTHANTHAKERIKT